MKVVFRTDAADWIGTGHVMRCLTLAHALRELGAICTFLCREFNGNQIQRIKDHGFCVHVLSVSNHGTVSVSDSTPQTGHGHAHWLNVSELDDAIECWALLETDRPDWIIVDHYALSAEWENKLSGLGMGHRTLVIDDLADRHHQCDILVDQTYGRNRADYQDLTPDSCLVLVGSEYALLRPEFARLRSDSLRLRNQREVSQVLIAMGGVDQGNATGQVLNALAMIDSPQGTVVKVVMGSLSPWLSTVREQSESLDMYSEVIVDTPNIANIMAESTLAIGAAGSTAWERCCLGLPSLIAVLAKNQELVSKQLIEAGAAERLRLEDLEGMAIQISTLLHDESRRIRIGNRAAKLVDGQGISRVIGSMRRLV